MHTYLKLKVSYCFVPVRKNMGGEKMHKMEVSPKWQKFKTAFIFLAFFKSQNSGILGFYFPE